MTKEEFDQITDWPELLEFCSQYDLSTGDDILCDDEVHDKVRNMLENDGWEDVAYFFSEGPDTNCSYYLINGRGCLIPARDFDDIKNSVEEDFLQHYEWDEPPYMEEEATPEDEVLQQAWVELFQPA